MAVISSFPPVFSDRARVLILGSMPGVASLAAGQYYAHPQNAFWKIMGALFGAGLAVSYPERLEILTGHRVALWDVLACCEREGSLDAQIRAERPNDFPALFSQMPALCAVFFNGQKAAQSFRRFVSPGLVSAPSRRMEVLPSTSPAHASVRFEEKLARWRAALSSAGIEVRAV